MSSEYMTNPYKMSTSLNVLNHLGLHLYRNTLLCWRR